MEYGTENARVHPQMHTARLQKVGFLRGARLILVLMDKACSMRNGY
jgi:hypothetical protein